MNSSDLVERVVEMVRSPRLRVRQSQRGWPALLDFDYGGIVVPLALFIGPVSGGHREERRTLERRWQNRAAAKNSGTTGVPIIIPRDHLGLLMGAWLDDADHPGEPPVFVVANERKREGLATRYSVFAQLALLREAAARGWAEGAGGDGEWKVYLRPALLPTYLDLRLAELPIPTDRIVDLASSSGVADASVDEVSLERMRRQSSALVRSSRFSSQVIEAYGGLCSMCGLNLGLVEGAHIYPAHAPASPDSINNGLALCPNHHAAFDRHLIAVAPHDFRVMLHPSLLRDSQRSPMSASFVQNTEPQLRLPQDHSLRPDPGYFRRRQEHYGERLSWAS